MSDESNVFYVKDAKLTHLDKINFKLCTEYKGEEIVVLEVVEGEITFIEEYKNVPVLTEYTTNYMTIKSLLSTSQGINIVEGINVFVDNYGVKSYLTNENDKYVFTNPKWMDIMMNRFLDVMQPITTIDGKLKVSSIVANFEYVELDKSFNNLFNFDKYVNASNQIFMPHSINIHNFKNTLLESLYADLRALLYRLESPIWLASMYVQAISLKVSVEEMILNKETGIYEPVIDSRIYLNTKGGK